MSSGAIFIAVIVIIALGSGITLYFFNQKTAAQFPSETTAVSPIEKPVIHELYMGLREQALKTKAADIDVKVDPEEPYGVVMDWHLENGIMTLVTFRTGDASMYFSSGAAVIGGGQHEHISKTAKEFVSSGKLIAHGSNADTGLPEKAEEVRFHVLRTDGTTTTISDLDELEAGRTPLTKFFDKANYLIAELQKTAEDHQ